MGSLLLRNVVHEGIPRDVWIRDGRFARIAEDVAEPADKILDAKGRKTILPAFYNAHTHAAMTLLRGYADDLPLFEWLQNHIWPMEARMTADDIYAGTRLACLEMIRSGTVFFNDMYWHYGEAIRAACDMGMRICGGPLLLDAFTPDATAAQRKDVEAFLERCADLPATVLPALTPHSVYGVRPETLRWAGARAAEAGIGIHIHLSETEKEVRDCWAQHGCRPANYLHRAGLLTDRTVAAHAIHLTDDERALLAEHGVTLAHMPISNMKLCNGRFDVEAAHAHGLRIALSTDGCSSNNCLDMIQEMKFAALLAKHATGEPTAFPAPAVFRAATRDAAEAFGLEAGVIEPGRLADCILVQRDHPRLTPGYHLISDMVYSADASVIDTVICDGKILMQDGKVEGEAEILDAARASACRLVQQKS